MLRWGVRLWVIARSGLCQHTLEEIMFDKAFVDYFAADWIDSWNNRDIERVLSHYSDDFEMSSPLIIKVAGEPSGALKGKQKIRAYWAKALQMDTNLHFELIATLVGVNSLALYYKTVRGLSAEVFQFNQERKVSRAYAHYTQNL